MKALYIAALLVMPLAAREPLAQRIAHADPTKYRKSPSVHNGAGALDYMALFDYHALDTNLFFLHRGYIEPHSGIGEHFHNQCEEMFVIFDGEAQFTLDGRTSLVKGPAGVPCKLGHAHGIYNPTDKPVQWMNINVTLMKGTYDAFNLDDNRANAVLDPIPQFMVMRLDRNLLRNQNSMLGGKGEVQYRRALEPSVFTSQWSYVDHLVVPPGASVGSHMHREQAEFYYVMNGSGNITVGGETAPVKALDAIPIQLGEMHSVENTGSEPLEFMIVGVSRDTNRNIDTVDASQMPARRGGGGGAGAGGGRGGRGGRGNAPTQ